MGMVWFYGRRDFNTDSDHSGYVEVPFDDYLIIVKKFEDRADECYRSAKTGKYYVPVDLYEEAFD